MIQPYKNVRAARLIRTERVIGLAAVEETSARLIRLNSASSRQDLRALAGNHLEASREPGKSGSVREPEDVEIVDYH
jgi:hypothetical protein